MSEKKAVKINGYLGILIIAALLLIGILIIVQMANGQFTLLGIILAVLCILAAAVLSTGIMVVQPNQAKALVFFGRYVGSVRDSGLWLAVPLCDRRSVSLRVRNFNSSKLKVNDVDGNPIEIAAVIVFKVVDSYKSLFDVDQYEEFVEIQSESALRQVASRYPYDSSEQDGFSLRSHSEEVAKELMEELDRRLTVAGVDILDARLTHLAYSTEIASAMLQRQQASAIVAARKRIVEGAVGMVHDALEMLQKEAMVELDEERKAAMINNLMVAIVSDRGASPVINTGSIY